MTLKDAKALRREVRDVYGYHCVVPLGFAFRPDRYVVRIFSAENYFDFRSRREFRLFHAKWLKAQRARLRYFRALGRAETSVDRLPAA